MASFQAETGWDIPKNGEKNFFVPNHYYPTRVRKFINNSKKTQKIKKKKKKIIQASFQAEICRDWPKKREKKKNFRFDPFLPDPSYKNKK